jgi:NDP-sugar pyrophosphorylase family protein
MNNLSLIIMAGGEGTRLRPLTRILPKPLLCIDNETIIEKIIDNFKASGIGKIYLITKYLSELIILYCEKKKLEVDIIKENEYKGTIGGLKLLENNISDQFFISNCDIIANCNYEDVLKKHNENDCILTVITFEKNISVPYGIFEFTNEGKLLDIKEKPDVILYANAGIYLMNKRILSYINNNENVGMDVLITRLIDNKENIYVYPIKESDYYDIGEFQEYKKVLEKL